MGSSVCSVSSETVSQHRHSDKERAGPERAATEAPYFLSGTQEEDLFGPGTLKVDSNDILNHSAFVVTL